MSHNSADGSLIAWLSVIHVLILRFITAVSCGALIYRSFIVDVGSGQKRISWRCAVSHTCSDLSVCPGCQQMFCVRTNIQHALRLLLCGHWGRGRLRRGPLAVSRTGVIALWCKPDSDKVIRADTVVAAQLTVMNGVLNASAIEWRTSITLVTATATDYQRLQQYRRQARRYVCNRALSGHALHCKYCK